MVGLPPVRDDEEKLTAARGEFVSSLPRRLEVLRAGLAALSETPGDRDRRNGLLRRLHALSSAARVLGFASVAEVLSESERSLRKAGQPGGSVINDVTRALDVLPSLMLGAPLSTGGPTGVERAPVRPGPLGVLLYGPPSLAEGFDADGVPAFELTRADDDVAAALNLARSSGPDAVIVDADRRGARELVEGLRADDLIAPLVVIVVGNFATNEAAAGYLSAGADRVLPKPASPEALRRALLELRESATQARGPREPVGELSVEELAERIAVEIKKGLTDSVEAGGKGARIGFGEGADVLGAVWGAVARVRELVTLRSGGNVRFQQIGPEGAVPLAPWTGEERRAGERGARGGRSAEDVALKGRRVIVADDDPAVVWFLSGLLKAVGVEVIEAHDGERALERTFETWPDLVVSDVLMPRRDGFSLCHEIKRDVVVRDVPVILLSWKEDLLQRVRELGAGADGYLRKEAAASTVIERVREVLRPRARIEQRLRVGGEVRGRLDGLTPRLILELMMQASQDATLSVRDAVYLYEVQVRGGRVKSLTRSASDGSFERGPKVLVSLLGVSAGRFMVEPNSAPCRTEFDAPLGELLAEPVRRARSALAALSAQNLPQVVGVDIDLDAVGAYFSCTPESARALIERLSGGGSPRQMLLTGEVSALLLEAVLSDLARRGAVRSVEHDAAPLVPGGSMRAVASSVAASAAESFDAAEAFSEPPPPAERAAAIESAWSEPPTATANVTRASQSGVTDGTSSTVAGVGSPMGATSAAETAPGAVSVAATTAAAAAGAASLAATTTAAAAVSLAATATAAAASAEPSQALPRASTPPPPEDGWFSFQLDPTASRELPKVEPIAEALPVAQAAPRESTPLGLGPTEEARSLGPTEEARPAAANQAAREAAPPAAAVTNPSPISFSNDSLDGLTLSSAPPPAAAENPQRPGVRPVLRLDAVRDRSSPSMADVFAAALEESPESVPPPSSGGRPSVKPAPVETKPAEAKPVEATSAEAKPLDAKPVDTEPVDAKPAEAKPSEAVETKSVAEKAVEEKPSEAKPDEGDRKTPESGSAPVAEPTKLSEAPRAEPTPLAAKTSVPTAESKPAPRVAKSSTPKSATPAPAKVSEKPSEAPPAPSKEGIGRTLLLVVAAFVGAFLLVDRVIVPRLAPSDPVAPTPEPSALVAATRASAAPPAGPALKLEELGIPSGVDLGANRALIDIVGQEGDALYVDGTFVGRGPGRSVPVAAGRHEVRITRGDAVQSLPVEIAAGKRIRVSLAAPTPARPSP